MIVLIIGAALVIVGLASIFTSIFTMGYQPPGIKGTLAEICLWTSYLVWPGISMALIGFGMWIG